jgi:hypothetical protein
MQPVVFEVLTAVSVESTVFWDGLVEMYHAFIFYHEYRGGMFLDHYGGNRANCFLQNICKFLPHFISKKMKNS